MTNETLGWMSGLRVCCGQCLNEIDENDECKCTRLWDDGPPFVMVANKRAG